MIQEDLTLDPPDWREFRTLARQMVDDMVDHLFTLRDRPAWQPMPSCVLANLDEPLPIDGQGADSAYRSFVENVLPYPNGNLHPRFFGWVQGNGTPIAMMADMLAAGLNPHMAGFNQAPAVVEERVISWMVELMGFPNSSSGLLMGGATIANIMGLAVARNKRAGFDVRKSGVLGAARRLTVYGSAETHAWVIKGVELLGLGRDSYRQVPVDSEYRIDAAALRQMIAEDRAEQFHPICVIGNAGTVNIGATDDLQTLARICREEELWFHVDGAFGALAQWSERLKPLVAGVSEADSLAFDLHKWMYQPFTVACLLVRDESALHGSFATQASYLAPPTDRGVSAGGLRFADRGIDLTREFRALKVWMSLKTHGVRAITRVIEQNVDQARMLAKLVDEHPDLELLAPVPLNVVCFRYAPRMGMSDCFWNLNQPGSSASAPGIGNSGALQHGSARAIRYPLHIRESPNAIGGCSLTSGRRGALRPRGCYGTYARAVETDAKDERTPAKLKRCLALFQMAEVTIPKNVFANILRMIAELRPPPLTSTA